MKTKTVKIALEGFGSYLGMEKGCFTVKNREGKTDKYPLFENQIDEIIIKSGNSISSGALASCGFWGIDCLFLTQKGKPARATSLHWYFDYKGHRLLGQSQKLEKLYPQPLLNKYPRTIT